MCDANDSRQNDALREKETGTRTLEIAAILSCPDRRTGERSSLFHMSRGGGGAAVAAAAAAAASCLSATA